MAQKFLGDLDEKQPPNQDQPTQEQPSKEQPTQEQPSKEQPAKEQPTHLPRVNEVVQKFLADLDEERKRLSAEFPLCALLIDEAVDRVYGTGHIPGKERFSDVYQQKPMKITQKVFVPVNQFPKFNFVGKILGPKGNSLRRLQEESQCKIAIKGRSSIRDRNKEEQLRSSGDRRYAHLEKNLFLEVSTVAPPAECYARIAYALAEIRKYLIPDDNDEVWHEQQRELMEMNPELAKNTKGLNLPAFRSVFEKMIGGKRTGVAKYNKLIKRDKENPPKSVFDETFGGNRTGVPKYNNLIKRDKENPPEVADMEEVAYDYDEHRMPPSRPSVGYENIIPRPSIIATKAAPFKRPYPYPTDMNRMREPPIKSYKPNSHTILKKFINNSAPVDFVAPRYTRKQRTMLAL
ncbi:KH domain-containing, RNA-binding, signal transduction-associated protein 1-like [Drosophila mauritiana]|uniref:KH domain-containing, RNA-binding, signal transduction-associated protein 1-like n=1 Tax=Drosophila mauritiana TaxID=7226 RepID=A0A6P8JAJ2_DROMA|nr:KH domain-containing, RNA-binding, signal transduction-associated protein 1-like [Drosophila mauritiana]